MIIIINVALTKILRDLASPSTYVKAYEPVNGDAVFEQYIDNKLKSKYILQRNQHLINATYYSRYG